MGLKHSVIQITCYITRGAHVEFNKMCVSPLFVLCLSLTYHSYENVSLWYTKHPRTPVQYKCEGSS